MHTTFKPTIILSLILAACGKDHQPAVDPLTPITLPPGIDEVGRASAQLQAVQSCGELEASIKTRLKQELEAQAKEQYNAALDWIANQDTYCAPRHCDGGLLGLVGGGDDDCQNYTYESASGPRNAAAPAPSAGASADGSGAKSYTTTNTQVVGVDEADFIENDGQFIYVVAGGHLSIFKAWPAEEAGLLSKTPLDNGTPTKLFVTDNRAVVYAETLTNSCGYGYDGGYPVEGDGASAKPQTVVSVFDVSDRSVPKLERTLRLDGTLIDARRVDKDVHTVLAHRVTWLESFNGVSLSFPTYCGSSLSKDAVEQSYQAHLVKIATAVDSFKLDSRLPTASNTDVLSNGVRTTTNDLFLNCANFYNSPVLGTQGFLSVVSFPLNDDKAWSHATIVGESGEVYASAQNLYVAVPEYAYSGVAYCGMGQRNTWFLAPEQVGEFTAVHKFQLGAGTRSTVYRGSGKVSGHPLNQFALDEYQDHLRIATTLGKHSWAEAKTNALYVLKEEGSPGSATLKVAGKIENLAKTEDIRAVRFDGNRGFVVTFKKTDPLFTFDLSNPQEPKVMAELKIPGFSTYMHFLDDAKQYLLTIGFDADDQGDFAWYQGIALQVFDVRDMNNPKLLHKESIGSRGTNSDATENHLAFTFLREKGLLALPMGLCEGTSGGSAIGSLTFNGLMMYRVTVDKGFEKLGRVNHADDNATETNPYYGGGCTWWENPNSTVKRSIVMDDYVYSVTASGMKVSHIVGNELVSIPRDLGFDGSAFESSNRCYNW